MIQSLHAPPAVGPRSRLRPAGQPPPTVASPHSDPSGAVPPLPVWPWTSLQRPTCRRLLPRLPGGAGIVLALPWTPGLPTVVFIHGHGGAPAQFGPHAQSLGGQINLAAYLYDDEAPLEPAALHLQRDLEVLPRPVVIVAYSMGALLPAFLGTNDRRRCLAALSAVYLNPLIGGSRHADADRLLAVLGEIRGLHWLHEIKRMVLRRFFAAAILDLDPESSFQQAIFGRKGGTSSFASRTQLLFTELPGAAIDVRAERALKLFGRPRGELLHRLGTPMELSTECCLGHRTPLTHPHWVTPLLQQAVVQATAESVGSIAATETA